MLKVWSATSISVWQHIDFTNHYEYVDMWGWPDSMSRSFLPVQLESPQSMNILTKITKQFLSVLDKKNLSLRIVWSIHIWSCEVDVHHTTLTQPKPCHIKEREEKGNATRRLQVGCGETSGCRRRCFETRKNCCLLLNCCLLKECSVSPLFIPHHIVPRS